MRLPTPTIVYQGVNKLNGSFSSEITKEEGLRLVIILCKICVNQSLEELSEYVTIVSKYVGDTDFNKILRRSAKAMESRSCGKNSCQDWLFTNLFELYRVGCEK